MISTKMNFNTSAMAWGSQVVNSQPIQLPIRWNKPGCGSETVSSGMAVGWGAAVAAGADSWVLLSSMTVFVMVLFAPTLIEIVPDLKQMAKIVNPIKSTAEMIATIFTESEPEVFRTFVM